MSILEQGCTCESCLEITKQNLQRAREEWENGKRKISFIPWFTDDDYGTEIHVNGFMLNRYADENVDATVEYLMEFLEIDGVKIKYGDDDEE